MSCAPAHPGSRLLLFTLCTMPYAICSLRYARDLILYTLYLFPFPVRRKPRAESRASRTSQRASRNAPPATRTSQPATTIAIFDRTSYINFVMPSDLMPNSDDFDLSFKVFHELMAKKVTDILLVSSPYEAFIMEEEGRLAERIIHEYRGLNLSRPPMLTWVSSAPQALEVLARKKFDLVITMPQVDEINAYDLGKQIKAMHAELPVYLMIQDTSRHLLERKYTDRKSIDRVWVWYGNSDLLLALIKNREDQMNVAYDTRRARVRVIIMVEDSPIYYSSLLPLLYKEIVTQTQAVMEESVNDEHRILRMRARPKILLAETFEEALDLYQQYRPYLLSVFSDVRFPRDGQMDDQAGFKLLRRIRQEDPDLPLLNLSSEESNRHQAREIAAMFLNKNSPTLHSDIRSFFMTYLGFGDFIFRTADWPGNCQGIQFARDGNHFALYSR